MRPFKRCHKITVRLLFKSLSLLFIIVLVSEASVVVVHLLCRRSRRHRRYFVVVFESIIRVWLNHKYHQSNDCFLERILLVVVETKIFATILITNIASIVVSSSSSSLPSPRPSSASFCPGWYGKAHVPATFMLRFKPLLLFSCCKLTCAHYRAAAAVSVSVSAADVVVIVVVWTAWLKCDINISRFVY